MQRIDAHQHFWIFDPDRDSWITADMAKIQRDFLPKDLAPLLKENRIDGCIAVQADQSLKETDFLLALAHKNDFIKGVVGWVDLKSTTLADTLAGYRQRSILKGFRHILQGENLTQFLEDGIFEKGVATILAHGYSYDLLVYHNQLDRIQPMVERLCQNKENRLVLDHIGKPDLKTAEIALWQSNIRRLAVHENLYCKVSGLVTEADLAYWKPADFTEALDTVLDAFGPSRLIFGSDWPVCLLATGYSKWLETITNYFEALTSAEKADIFGGNAVRFYGIDI